MKFKLGARNEQMEVSKNTNRRISEFLYFAGREPKNRLD
jgi:hypothetical protein